MITAYISLSGFDGGIVGFTKKNGNTIGCVCHNLEPNTRVSVVLSGPSTVVVNDSATFTLTISGGPAVAGGCDISASLGNVYESYLDGNLRRDEPFSGAGFELTHRHPVLSSGGIIQFTFKYVAPSVANVIDTIFATGNSVNHDTTSDNDQWNFGENFLINVIDNPLPVELSSFIYSIAGRDVRLNWTTASEINNQGFDIERSGQEGTWMRVGYVKGEGTSNLPVNYSFADRNLIPGEYNYRLKQTDYNGSYEYFQLLGDVVIGNPSKFNLSQNYPNPFNPVTKIKFEIPEIMGDQTKDIKVVVFDAIGKEVATIFHQKAIAGIYETEFDGSNLNSGIYFYRLTADEFVMDTKKMILIR